MVNANRGLKGLETAVPIERRSLGEGHDSVNRPRPNDPFPVAVERLGEGLGS
jgi:hypothetical protein